MSRRYMGTLMLLGTLVVFSGSGCDDASSSGTSVYDNETPSSRTSVYDNEFETVQEYADRNDISFEVAECEFRLDELYTSRGEVYDPAELGRACGNPHDMP